MQKDLTRRDFLKAAGAVTAGVIASGVARSPVYALGSQRVLGANDRIRIGIIGVGGMGGAHMRSLVEQSKNGEENMEVVAVCDIWEKNKQRAKEFTGGKLFHEYEKLLEDKDIDAVLIATPEHWHQKMACDAMEAGKDVYLEKPLCRYLEEAKKIYQTALRTKRVLQVGSQGCSDDKWRKANELIKAGKIGKVIWSQTSYCRNNPGGEWNYGIDPDCTPETLDWNRWLGPARETVRSAEFSPEYYFRWRKYWAFSGGITHDLFPHRLHPFMLAIGAEFPARVVATGGNYVHKTDRDVPDTIHLMADFPSGHTMFVAGSTVNERGLEDLIRGHEANMFIGGNTITIRPERPYADKIEEMQERAGGSGEDIRLHEKNWQQCIRTREKPFCDVELAYRVMVTIALAEISYRQNKMVRFDPERLEMMT